MSGYFLNDVIYIIVPTADVTNEMENNMKSSFYSASGTHRVSTDGTDTLFKVRNPISAAFNGYVWYNETDIKIELDKAEWVPSV